MSAHRLLLPFAVAALALLLGACRGGDDGGGGVGPASPTPTEESRTVISDDGKLTLEVPPDALDEDVPITITAVPLEELPQELQVLRGAGDGYRLEPDGLRFSEPVAVSLELSRGELENEPEDGITAYALVSLPGGGEPELLNALVTEATLGEETVVARGELSHFSWITRTKGSLVVSLEKKPRIQLVGATFKAKGSVGNGDLSNTVTLEGPSATFLAFGTVSASGDTFTPPHPNLDPGAAVRGTGAFVCGKPGLGTYTLRGKATSVVEVEDQEPIRKPLTVTVDSVVECVADEPTPTPTPTPTPMPTEAPDTGGTAMYVTDIRLGVLHPTPGVPPSLFKALVCAGLGRVEPVEGATVEATASGPGIIGDPMASGVTEADGCVHLDWDIGQFGEYTVTVDNVSNTFTYDPSQNVVSSASIEVTAEEQPIER